MSTATIILIIGLIGIAILGIAAMLFLRKRRTEGLRTRFGPEYARALEENGDRRHAEASLEERKKRVERFKLRLLTPGDRARFTESWRAVQARFVDDPKVAVTESDQLLGDVMSTRGYPVSDFEQRTADISVDHPKVVDNYRAAHEIALRHAQGQASTEDLRQAMIHYRTLFMDLVSEPELAGAKAAS
jgi:LPXTG-motif cell wall-anchored protein